MNTAVIGAPEFKAKNGLIVKPCENGGIEVGRPGYRDYTLPEASLALEEFFQKRGDEERGRWRDPFEPHYVVYPVDDGATVRVLDERDGVSTWVNRNVEATDTGHYGVAYRFFEAHPDRKPWDDAKASDVWILSVNGRESAARVTTWANGEVAHPIVFFTTDGAVVASGRVDHARRIWPEEAA